MDRRDFLLSAGALAAATNLPDTADAGLFFESKVKSPAGLSVLQGHTTETTTQLSVDVPNTIQCAYVLKDTATGQVFDPITTKVATFDGSDTRVDKLQFAGLELGHKYNFVITNKKDNKILDDRFLTTVDLNKQGARVALMSCMNASKTTRTKIWASAEAANLDYLFFIGDNVYGDNLLSHSSKLLWSKYVEGRKAIPYYHWKNLKPVIAVWDDHDFGKNDARGDYKNKTKNLEIFNAFFAQEADGKTLFRGPGNSSFFQAFNQNFAFCDNRYYRELPYADGTLSFLGVDQINFMTNNVDKNLKATFLLEGSPWFGRTQKNMTSYQQVAPKEQEAFFKVIQSWGVPVLFGAGDVHFSEISSLDKSLLGFNSYEIVSSCMHSSPKSKFYDNPNPQMNGYLKENFIVLEHVGRLHDLTWKASCIAVDSKKIFESALKIA